MNNHVGVIRLPIQRLHLEITNICNFSCEFCPNAHMTRAKGMMPLNMAKSILDEVGRTRIVNLVLLHVMGEPMLNPHLVEIAQHARSRKVDVCLTTNASRLSEEVLLALCRARVKHIIISLQTPDRQSFAMRGAKDLCFDEYAQRITSLVRFFLRQPGKMETSIAIDFLTSPLRRLVIPLMEEFSIIDTTRKLRQHLETWVQHILQGTPFEYRLPDALGQIRRATVFRENRISVTPKLTLHTRIVGDWANHFQKSILPARFGYCPGLQENFGILWNGDFVFCCTDFDGSTSTANFRDMSIIDYLRTDVVQEAAAGFRRLRILHPHCRRCMGDSSLLKSVGKQVGSIFYFKLFKKISPASRGG
ncbi:MAG TPA: hypothetical protein DCZ69_09730 [Syntrophobacteraceae bacterium]|nr:hypothetical protein [Syntrophobacteraceae bacterium]